VSIFLGKKKETGFNASTFSTGLCGLPAK